MLARMCKTSAIKTYFEKLFSRCIFPGAASGGSSVLWPTMLGMAAPGFPFAEAQERWFTTDEILSILKDPAAAGLQQSSRVAHQPAGGSLFIFDRDQTRDFKLDGWNWTKKNKSHGAVREDRVALRLKHRDGVRGEVAITALHAHSFVDDAARVGYSLKRRVYSRHVNYTGGVGGGGSGGVGGVGVGGGGDTLEGGAAGLPSTQLQFVHYRLCKNKPRVEANRTIKAEQAAQAELAEQAEQAARAAQREAVVGGMGGGMGSMGSVMGGM